MTRKSQYSEIIPLIISAIGLCLVFCLFGCTATYVVTNDLETPVDRFEVCSIGAITDGLPAGTNEMNKPTLETIDKLKTHLAQELTKRGFKVYLVVRGRYAARYEITGSILSYKEDSGSEPFLIDQGKTRIITYLKLIDMRSGKIVFAGNFVGEITDDLEFSDKMTERVARDFAKQLDKRSKKLEEAEGVAGK